MAILSQIEIDAVGMLCPLPVLRLRKRLSEIASGEVACLVATDPAAQIDVPHFCNEQGHAFLGSDSKGETTSYYVKKR